jgi:hypothetical protein
VVPFADCCLSAIFDPVSEAERGDIWRLRDRDDGFETAFVIAHERNGRDDDEDYVLFSRLKFLSANTAMSLSCPCRNAYRPIQWIVGIVGWLWYQHSLPVRRCLDIPLAFRQLVDIQDVAMFCFVHLISDMYAHRLSQELFRHGKTILDLIWL